MTEAIKSRDGDVLKQAVALSKSKPRRVRWRLYALLPRETQDRRRLSGFPRDGVKGLEIPAVSRFRAARLRWPGDERVGDAAHPPIRLCATTRTVERNESRSDVDVDMIHIAIGHDSAAVVVGDEPTDDLPFFARNAEIDGPS